MNTMSHRRVAATLVAGTLLALPAASLGRPPADSLSEPQAPASAPRDYSKNSADGRFTAPRQESLGVTPIHTQIAPTAAQPTAQPEGFAWGDVAAGAGIALLIGGVGLGGRMVVRRHRSVGGIAS
jgi:hypothetical protein